MIEHEQVKQIICTALKYYTYKQSCKFYTYNENTTDQSDGLMQEFEQVLPVDNNKYIKEILNECINYCKINSSNDEDLYIIVFLNRFQTKLNRFLKTNAPCYEAHYFLQNIKDVKRFFNVDKELIDINQAILKAATQLYFIENKVDKNTDQYDEDSKKYKEIFIYSLPIEVDKHQNLLAAYEGAKNQTDIKQFERQFKEKLDNILPHSSRQEKEFSEDTDNPFFSNWSLFKNRPYSDKDKFIFGMLIVMTALLTAAIILYSSFPSVSLIVISTAICIIANMVMFYFGDENDMKPAYQFTPIFI